MRPSELIYSSEEALALDAMVYAAALGAYRDATAGLETGPMPAVLAWF